MPTEVELQRKYGVSRHTMSQVFQDLVAEGLVYRAGEPSLPAFLSAGTIYACSELSRNSWRGPAPRSKCYAPPETRTDTEAARRLGLPSDEVSGLIVRRFYEGVPFVVTHVCLSPEAGERLKTEALYPEGSVAVLGTLEQSILPHPVGGG
jgi:GntR family transcriptional regulator